LGDLSQIIHGFAELPGAGGTVSAPLRTPIPLPLASFPFLSQIILTFEDALNLVGIKGADFFQSFRSLYHKHLETIFAYYVTAYCSCEFLAQ
jgi:hypothetical protein